MPVAVKSHAKSGQYRSDNDVYIHFLLGIDNMMFLLTKTHPNTFLDNFSSFQQQVLKKFQFFAKICWGLGGGWLRVEQIFGGWVGVGWGLSEGWMKSEIGETHIPARHVCYTPLNRKKVCLNKSGVTEPWKCTKFEKNIKKYFGWGLSGGWLRVEWGLSGGWLGVEKTHFYIFFKLDAFWRFCDAWLV